MDFVLFLFYSVGYLMYFEAGGVSGEPCVTSSATVDCQGAPHSERWFYESGQCRPFVWLGCGSTDNVFETKYQCDAKCPPQSKSSGEVQLSADGGQSPTPRCDDPVKMGPCEAAIPRFHYVPTLRMCQRFLWGGCDPNGNNFLTAEACEEACTDPCRLPGDSGDCEAALPRWYYNPTSRACEVFVYGGCGGNANNFKTRVECENQCAGPLVAGSFRTSPSLCLLGALLATMLLV